VKKLALKLDSKNYLSKKWKPNPFRHLDKNWDKEFLEQQEKKLDADHSWQPKKDADEPIGGEYAKPDPNRRT
jgi:hypothetical protein